MSTITNKQPALRSLPERQTAEQYAQAIGRRIHETAKANGIALHALHRAAGVAESTLHKRAGKHSMPSTRTLAVLLPHLGPVDLHWLLTGEGDAPEGVDLAPIDDPDVPEGW